MLKIAIVNDCGLPPENLGGVEQYTSDLASILQEAGNDITVVCPSSSSNRNKYNFNLHEIKPFGNFWKNRLEFRVTYYVRYKRLYKALKQIINKVDIIHTHNPYSAGLVGSIIGANYKKPIVMTFHLNLLNFFNEERPRYHEKIAKSSLRNYKNFVVNTNTLKDALIERFKIDSNYIKVISPYVNIEKFNLGVSGEIVRKELNIPKNSVVLLFVGRLVTTKDVLTLLKAIKHMRDDNMFCLIIGNGPLENDLKKYCQNNNLGLEKKIFFLNKITVDNLPKYYAACDIFVLPSISEGFGLTFLEAWASGKSVIGTDIPIVKNEVIKNGINGLIFERGNYYSLAEKIKDLINNTETRMRMGLAGRTLVENNFSARIFLTKHLKLYENLITNRGK
ncbi:MAG: glycosyltransferase family 4 protein [Candidatus Omnitrophota bacterium]